MLIQNKVGCVFKRTKTLGDGDDICNCVYLIEGNCEWSPKSDFKLNK